MSQTPTPGFIERFENCDLKDFKKEDLDMITREMNILYSKLRELVIYNATSLEIFLTYLRQGNLQLAELFRKRALFELLTIEEDRNYIMLMEEHDIEDGCKPVVQYSEYYFDPEEKEQGPTLLEEKRNQNPEKINVEERSRPTKRLKDNTEVAGDYFDPEFERRLKRYRRKRLRTIKRKTSPDVSISDQRSVIKEQRMSPEGGYSTKKDIVGNISPESTQQNIEVSKTNDHKNSSLLSSNIDQKRVVQEGVNDAKPSQRNGSAKPLKEITNNLACTLRRGMVGGSISPDKSSDTLNSVSNVINEKNHNLVKNKTKAEQVSDEKLNERTNTWNPLKQNTNIGIKTNIITLQELQSTQDHDEYIHMKDEENDDKMKQPRDFIDVTTLIGPDMSSITSHSENDESSSPEQKEFDEVSTRSPISLRQESDSSGRYLLMTVNTDDHKTTSNSKRERVVDETSDDNNNNMVIQKREIHTQSPNESIEASRSLRTTKEDSEGTITEKDTNESIEESRSPRTTKQNSDGTITEKHINESMEASRSLRTTKEDSKGTITGNETNESIEASRSPHTTELDNEDTITQKEKKESIVAPSSPRTTKQDKEDTITEKDTYETNTLKLTAELEDTTKEITETKENINHSSTSLQGNVNVENLSKPSMILVGNAASSDNIIGLDRSTMKSEYMSEANTDNTHFMSTERSTREVAFNRRRDDSVGANIYTGGLNAAEEERRTDSSMSIWQDNKSNAEEPKVKYISSKIKFPKDEIDSDYKNDKSVKAMNYDESMNPDSVRKGRLEDEANAIDATESASGSMLVGKDQDYDEKVTRVVNDQKSERLFYDTNPTDQTRDLEIRSDVVKERLITENPKNNGHKIHITRRLSIGSLGTLSPIREGEQITDETDLKVSTEFLSQPYLEETSKTNNTMEKGDDQTEEIKMSLNEDSIDGTSDGSKSRSVDETLDGSKSQSVDETLDGSKSQSVDGTLDGSKSQSGNTNIEEKKYQDSNNTSKGIDGRFQIGDAVNATNPLKQNVDFDNLTSASEGEKDKMSSDSNRTKHLVDAETFIQHEGTPNDGSESKLKQNVDSDNLTSASEGEKDKMISDSNRTKHLVDAETFIQHEGTPNDGSKSDGLNAINTGINTESRGLLTDNSFEMIEYSLSYHLSEERGDTYSLGQDKITMSMKEEPRTDVDNPHETQADNKNSSQHAFESKDKNGLQSNSLDVTSVTIKSKDEIDSVQNENSKRSKGLVSDEGKVMETKQSKRSSRERSISSQNGALAQMEKGSTRTENPKFKEIDPGLKQTFRGDSDPLKEGEDQIITKDAEKRINTAKLTDDKIKAKIVLQRVNKKMAKLDQHEEMDHASVKKERVSNGIHDATINIPIQKFSTSHVQLHGDREGTLTQIDSNEQAGDEIKKQNVHDPEEVLRRSKEASLLLKQGNPNITDLSDNNRPTNLAERFSELYDNEYTDAFEELQNMNFDERKIAHVLLSIVKDAYYFCSERASDERNRLMSVMKNVPAATSNENPSKTEALRKGIVAQSLKDNASSLSIRILKEFFDSRLQSLIPDWTTESQNPRLFKYVQVCVEIIWWMCVQDPAIYLSWIEETERREFDKDEYRSYTKSGKIVDFCVWPLVHLCKGGPILAKGIAQGK